MARSADSCADNRQVWLNRYNEVRAQTAALAAPLGAEDQQIQSMPDVSPTKWHLAHTSWFFETFVLAPFAPAYRPFHEQYGYLFNSYYEAVGDRWPRAERGLLSRPSLSEIMVYRAHVDSAVSNFMTKAAPDPWDQAAGPIELGLHHEQQHQELILMDIKHVLSISPLNPAYDASMPELAPLQSGLDWMSLPGGSTWIGHGGDGFAFDNEGPRHKVWLEPFRIASRPVSCGEFMAFIEDGGYRRPEFWLSEGWAAVQREGWQAPLYWREPDTRGQRTVFTLSGLRPWTPADPLCHVSFFEADAFARWSGKRLPTEAEWEVAALSSELHHIGQVWEWTASAYGPYPRYRPPSGAVGEYNGKFMSGQMVLRGGCAASPDNHIRMTYRNFYPPTARWAFSGVRLADDA